MNPGVNVGLHLPYRARPLAKPAAPPPAALAADQPATSGVVYVGRRGARGTAIVRVEQGGLERALPVAASVVRHSTRIEWGYRGASPTQLAVALLAHAAGPDAARALHQKLAEKITYGLPSGGWRLTRDEVLAAVGLGCGAGGAGRAA